MTDPYEYDVHILSAGFATPDVDFLTTNARTGQLAANYASVRDASQLNAGWTGAFFASDCPISLPSLSAHLLTTSSSRIRQDSGALSGPSHHI
jgi:hypothetical protein